MKPSAAPVGDVETRRANGHRMFDYVGATWKPIPGVDTDRFALRPRDGATLPPPGTAHRRRSAGQCGAVPARRRHDLRPRALGAIYELAVREYVARSGVPMLVVEYRVAPEHPHPTPVEDCYAALRVARRQRARRWVWTPPASR